MAAVLSALGQLGSNLPRSISAAFRKLLHYCLVFRVLCVQAFVKCIQTSH